VSGVDHRRWRRIQDIFEAAVELAPAARAAYVDETCAGDQSLRQEVMSLLAHDEKAKSFIEDPAFNIHSAPDNSHSTDLAPGVSIASYTIIKEIGRGGMGVVYLARDTKLKRRVALKLLPWRFTSDIDRVQRFHQEAFTASRLNHPNILTIYDIGESQHGHYIITEFIDGRTLRERMSDGGLGLAEVTEIMLQVASALKAAHTVGLVHRDIKPENIMIRHDGIVKVLDFGLVKLIERHDSSSNVSTVFHTRPGVLMGTPNYMSPEQVSGADVDTRSDIFSLGAVLYECITSMPAFSGSNIAAVWGEIQHVDPPPPSQINPRIPPELSRLTLKALAKRPELRHQSAAEVAEDLGTVLGALRSAEGLDTRSLSRKLSTLRIIPLKTISNIFRVPERSAMAALGLTALVVVSLVVWWAFFLQKNGSHRWREEGVKALRNGAYLQARLALEKAIQEDSRYALNHVRLAEAYLELDNREKAREALYTLNNLLPDRSSLPQREQLYVHAVVATEARDYASAVDDYRNIVRLSPGDPQAYLDLGRAYERNNDSANALANYQEARNLGPDYATPYLRLGILYGRGSQLAEAQQAFNQADEIYRAQGNVEGRAEVYYQHGVILVNAKQIGEARAKLEQALQFARSSSNEAQEILTKLQICSVSIVEGKLEQAQEMSRDAVEQAKRSGMQIITTRGLIDIGNAHYLKGDTTNAEAKYQEALESAASLKDERNEARARFSLGSLRIRQGRTDEGLPEMLKARDFYVRGGYSNEAALSLSMIGQTRRDKGEYDEALLAFREQLEIARQLNLPPLIASINDDIGQVFLYEERYPEALGSMSAGYRIYQTLEDPLGTAYNLLNQANVSWRMGHYDQAAAFFRQAREIAERNGGLNVLAPALNIFSAEMELSRRNFALAREHILRAPGAGQSEDKEAVIESRRLLGLIAALAGENRDEGVRLCKESLDLAVATNHPRLISRSQFSLAEAMLAGGNPELALETALQAHATFSRSKQLDSEWRALLLLARASEQVGDSAKKLEYLSKAKDVLSNLEQSWGGEIYKSYSTRPDIAASIKLLAKLAANKQKS
jgi:serine/threonine protein kinase/tetratricopeptide (TPR) repeat protein